MSDATRNLLDLVSLRQLRYFTSAMRAPTFHQAAREVAISQPALSEQIALLESALSVRLFDRTGGRATPTAAAYELNRRVMDCLGELHGALRSARERENTVSGLVRIGFVQSYGECWVLPVVRAMQAKWPQLSMTLRRRTAPALAESVMRGDLDLALSFDAEPHADLEIVPCFVEPVVAIGGPHGRARSIRLARLGRCDLALLPTDYAMRRRLDAAFAALGIKPHVRLESDVLEDLVRATHEKKDIVAVLNGAAALSLKVPDAMRIAEKGLSRQACLVRSRSHHHTQASRHLWDALLAGLPQIPGHWRHRTTHRSRSPVS